MFRYRELGLARVGIIGLVLVVAVILAGLQFQKAWSLSSGVRYQALFAEAGGLAVGDDVTMAGVTVGEVSAMHLDDGNVRVQFSVGDGVRLGTKTGASIKTRSLLGKRMVTVTSDGGGQLRPSDTIPLSRTSAPYSLPDALGGLTKDIAGIDTDQLNKSLNTLSSTLAQTSPELTPTFDGLTRLSQTINKRDDSLRDLLDSAGKVTGILAERSTKVNSLILSANELVGELSRRRQAVVDLLANTSAVSRQLNGVVADNQKELAPTIERLNRVTAVLEKNKDNLAQTLPGVAKYATALGESVANGPYYNAYVGNLLPAQFIQPFLNSAFGLPPVELPIPDRVATTMNKLITRVVAAIVIVAVLGAAGVVAYREYFGPRTVIAYFTSTTAIYDGDDVRVAGMKVGSIASITPQGTRSKVVMEVDRDVSIPADASAVIVAQSLIAARFVQLTPAYHDRGPRMRDNAVIPESRTAVPVEWDEIKEQLVRLADTVGPTADNVSGTLGTFIDTAGDAFEGNGTKLRQTLSQLSGAAKILSDGSGDLFATIKNLQTFVSALANSNAAISQFQSRFATLTSTINASRSDLDSALKNLSVAVVEVQRFVRDNRNGVSEQVQRLGNATQVLVDKRSDLEQVLHVAPTGLQNYNNIYNPDQGTVAGAFVLNNFSSPANFICNAIQSLQNATAEQGAKLCAQYLGPVLNTLSFNYPAFPINPSLGPSAKPENLVYSEPELRPGGSKAPKQTPTTAPRTIADLLAPNRGGR